MVNVLVVEDNLEELREITNNILGKNAKVRISCIVSSIDEAIDVLNSENIDIVIARLQDPDFTFDKIRDDLKAKYNASILVILEDKEEKITDNEFVFTYVIKGKNWKEDVIYNVNKLIKSKDISEIQKKIVKELEYIGYKINFKGTKYLADSILEMYINQKTSVDNLEGKIYPAVCKKYNTTISNVKSNINKATEAMYCDCEIERLKKYFHFYDDTKPTAKKVMITILNKIS